MGGRFDHRHAFQRSRRHGDPEAGALARACSPRSISPAEHLGQPLEMANPRPDPAVAPHGGGIGLAESLEEPRQLLRGDADSRIDHGELDHGPAGACRKHAQDHADAALFRELDRVANEVDEDLPQTHRVGLDRAGQRPLRFHGERQSLGGSRRAEHGHRRFDDLER